MTEPSLTELLPDEAIEPPQNRLQGLDAPGHGVRVPLPSRLTRSLRPRGRATLRYYPRNRLADNRYMMTDENGALPLAGWAIVQTNGLTLIGRLVGGTLLSPVYELKPQMAATQQGIQIGHLAVPVWLLGLRDVALPSGCLVERLEEFSPRIRRSLAQSVQAAEDMANMLRAEETGIVIARPDEIGMTRGVPR